jgi:hypothetical protein
MAYWERCWYVQIMDDADAALHAVISPRRPEVIHLDQCSPAEALAFFHVLGWLCETYRLDRYAIASHQDRSAEVHVVQSRVESGGGKYALPLTESDWSYAPAHAWEDLG